MYGAGRLGTETRISTVEHHCSQHVQGPGLDDALIDVSGPEIPIGDGSALCWSDLILSSVGIDSSQTAGAPVARFG